MSNIKLFQEYESLALDIQASVWISASAGGGKTTIIIKRILKLLLFGVFFPEMFHVEHSKIVVLTYTNESANEIKKRIKKKLYEWQIDIKNLEQDLDFFEISKNVPRGTFYCDSVKVCRGFFLNEIHLKLKIKSFHSFCAEIVQEYREESDYSSVNKYKIIDDVESSNLLKKISVNYLLKKKEYLYKIPELLDAIEKIMTNCSTWNNFDCNNSLSKFLKLKKTESSDRIVISFLDLEISQIVPRGTICHTSNFYKSNSNKININKLFHVEQFNNQKKSKIENNNSNCSTWNNLNSISKPKDIKNYSIENIKIMKCSTWNISNSEKLDSEFITKTKNVPRGTFLISRSRQKENCSTWNNLNSNNLENQIFSLIKEEIRKGVRQEDIIVLFRSRNTTMKKLLKLFHVEQFCVSSNTKIDIVNSPTLTFILLLLKRIVPRGTICHTSNFYKSNYNKININKLFHVKQFNNQKKSKIENNNSNCSTWNNLNSISKPKNIKNYSIENIKIMKCSTWNISNSEKLDSEFITKTKNVPRGTFLISKSNEEENCSTWNNFIEMIKRWKLANTRFKKNCSTWNNLNDEYLKIFKYLIGKSYKIQKLIHKLKLLINYLSSSEILDIINNSIGQLLDQKILLEIKKVSSSLISQNLSSIHCFVNYIESRKNLEVVQNQHKSKIRIMTIHGSKGLEADTVILIDDILERKFNHKLYINNEYKLFVKLNNDHSNEVKILRDVLEEEDFRESCRLLYVAMTRTKKKLIIIKPNQ